MRHLYIETSASAVSERGEKGKMTMNTEYYCKVKHTMKHCGIILAEYFYCRPTALTIMLVKLPYTRIHEHEYYYKRAHEIRKYGMRRK